MRLLCASAIMLASIALSAQTPPATIPAPPDVAAPPADAVKTPSGLATKVIRPGTAHDHPAPGDLVTVHYTGWTTDGKMFDSSVVRGKPTTFGVTRVIAGFGEGLQMMVVGEKRRLWIPESLAYQGASGKAGRHARVRRRTDRHAESSAGRRQGASERRAADRERPRLQDPQPGRRRTSSQEQQRRHGRLHGVDDRREDVRQLRDTGTEAGIVSARSGDCRLDRSGSS